MITFFFSTTFVTWLKAAPITGSPPRQGIPSLNLEVLLRTIPLKTKKCWSGTWALVCILVLDVLIPLTDCVLTELDVVPVFSSSEISSSISNVTIPLLPTKGVMLSVTPMLRYSQFALVVWLRPAVVTKEPVKGTLSPTKIFELRLS